MLQHYCMTEQIFTSLWVVIGVVLITMGIMKFFKQPMIIGYIVAGIILSIFLPHIISENIAIVTFSKIGISLLLFIVGMELNPLIIKDLRRSSIITWSLQVIVTAAVGYGLSYLLGFDSITSAYIGVGFAFSSTIVVLKLLSDQDETESTFGRLSIGILIVQDVIVMLVFLFLATFNGAWGGNQFLAAAIMFGKMILLGGGLYLISRYLIPVITKKIAETQEYLFLFAIGRCFIIGTIFYRLGFSIEIGALAAGITLATSSYRFEITSRVKSLRDFFIVIFFVLLGTGVNFSTAIHYIPQIICFVLFILVCKPIITMLILWIMWHTKKNNFLAWSSLAQISEFSFLLVAMGLSSWAIKDPNIASIITLVGLVSIAGSSYYTIYGEKIYGRCKACTRYIPGNRNRSYKEHTDKEYEIMLFGYGKFWSNLYSTLIQKHTEILVVDEHPWIISMLQKKWVPCMYGDAGDVNFLEDLNVKKTKMIISTIKKFDENMVLLKTLKDLNPHLIVILISHYVEEAIKLYEQGADYVILPHYIGANHTSLMLEEYGFDADKFTDYKQHQVNELRNRHQDMMLEALQMGK